LATSPYPLPVQPSQPVMVLGGRIDAAEIPALCDRVRALLETSGRFTLRCDVDSVVADASTINALARMALTCRRLGRRLELRGASVRLEQLVVFAGLSQVLPCLPDGGDERSGVQVRRQAKQWKEARRVEEERDPCDPIV
jgi:ABC-type transporter Mla MlaB component